VVRYALSALVDWMATRGSVVQIKRVRRPR
jgi:hypothetical protein